MAGQQPAAVKELERLIVDFFEASGAEVIEDGLEWFLSLYDEGPAISLTSLVMAALRSSALAQRPADEALATLAEAKALLVLAYSGKSYKSKINSAIHRLTHVERLLAPVSDTSTDQGGK